MLTPEQRKERERERNRRYRERHKEIIRAKYRIWWAVENIPAPTKEGETFLRVHRYRGYEERIEFVAVVCKKCGQLRWTSAANRGICFDCVIHREAAKLRRYIDARIKKGAQL